MPRSLSGTTGRIPPRGSVSIEVRKASLADIPALLALINGYAERGIMLSRTEFEMAENIRDFSVIRIDGQLAGCGALHIYTPKAAEIRSIAISAGFKGYGAGRVLMESLEAEAQTFGLKDVFAFTYIPDFFRKLGFVLIDRGELPLKAWKDCMRCSKFQCCDEIAVIKLLDSTLVGVSNTHIEVPLVPSQPVPDSDVRLPIIQNLR